MSKREVHRTTVDMPVELNDAVNEAVERTFLSKAQYIRMSLEVMNMLAGKHGASLWIEQGGKRVQLLIPGVL